MTTKTIRCVIRNKDGVFHETLKVSNFEDIQRFVFQTTSTSPEDWDFKVDLGDMTITSMSPKNIRRINSVLADDDALLSLFDFIFTLKPSSAVDLKINNIHSNSDEPEIDELDEQDDFDKIIDELLSGTTSSSSTEPNKTSHKRKNQECTDEVQPKRRRVEPTNQQLQDYRLTFEADLARASRMTRDLLNLSEKMGAWKTMLLEAEELCGNKTPCTMRKHWVTLCLLVDDSERGFKISFENDAFKCLKENQSLSGNITSNLNDMSRFSQDSGKGGNSWRNWCGQQHLERKNGVYYLWEAPQ